MNSKSSTPPVVPSQPGNTSSGPGFDPISQNIETVLAFYAREEQKLSRSQRTLESISNFLGRPGFLVSILVFVGLWILANVVTLPFGTAQFDPPPFAWLQGVLSLGALLTATVVLIQQNRLAAIEQQRDQLELQVNLLTEQKSTKIIELLEELRRDLPMVKDRDDHESAVFQQPTHADEVLAAIGERRETEEKSTLPLGTAKDDPASAMSVRANNPARDP